MSVTFKVGDWVKLRPEIWERNRHSTTWFATKDKSFLILEIYQSAHHRSPVLHLKGFVQSQILAEYFELGTPEAEEAFSLSEIDS